MQEADLENPSNAIPVRDGLAPDTPMKASPAMDVLDVAETPVIEHFAHPEGAFSPAAYQCPVPESEEELQNRIQGALIE